MKKRLLIVACLSLVFSLFLIAYLMVWLSGEYNDNQYTDTYRVFVTFGLALSYCTFKAEEKNMSKKAIEEYAKRGEQCDVMKALTLLTQAYISQCGISLGCRTVVYCAAEPWQERLAWMDLSLSEMARKEPFVHLMPYITKEYVPKECDGYDIAAMEDDELLKVCNRMIRSKEFDETTLEVLCWGLLKATEEEKWLSEEIETTAPDGTMLKGILEKQNCGGTWMTMTEPYELNVAKRELVRDARELLLTAYLDFQRLHQLKYVGTKMGKKHNLSEEYLNSLSEEERTKEMLSWTPEEQVRHLCPEGVMPLEEFRKIGIQMINDMYEEK